MKAALLIFGMLAGLSAGLVLLFVYGETPAVVGFAVIVLLSILGMFGSPFLARRLLTLLVLVLMGSVAFTGWRTLQVYRVLTDTSGPVDPPDPGALASVEAKMDGVDGAAGYRLELSEDELTAYVLDALQESEANPLQWLVLDVVDGEPGEQGVIAFTAGFKGGGAEGTGAVSAHLESGAVQIEIEEFELAGLAIPGVAEDALEDVIGSVANINDALAAVGADVQAIDIGDDRVLVVGTRKTTDVLTSETLLVSLQEQIAAAESVVTPPPERLGPGRINAPPGVTSGEAPFYVALGDSLAANVGVAAARDGYVSRFHRQLELRDGRQYGLHNFGTTAETTGTMIRGGQLDLAVEFLRDHDVAYVTIDIGANNLLGHLGSEDCSESLQAPACAQRIANAFEFYDDDLAVIFAEVREAAPDATIIFMLAYNPFSLGFADAVAFEAETDRVLAEFNAIAVTVAGAEGILVADAYGPMQGTTSATTHMLDAEPDIHPTPIGYDILAGSLLNALG